jgi:hypothetical protein
VSFGIDIGIESKRVVSLITHTLLSPRFLGVFMVLTRVSLGNRGASVLRRRVFRPFSRKGGGMGVSGLVFCRPEGRWGFWLRWFFFCGGFVIGFELFLRVIVWCVRGEVR